MKKTALITGSTRGIGFGIAKALSQEGYDLAINGRRPESEVGPVIDELASSGSNVLYCQGDISSREARLAMIGKVKSHFGKLNVLINNAGVAPRERRDILEAGEESFEYIIRTDLQGAYFLMQAAAHWMISQKEENKEFQGCMINISSVSATQASVNRGDYCIAKAGLSMATQLFAVRLGEYNIPVYEIRPGIIMTDMTSGVKEKYDRMLSEGLCLQNRWGMPEDVGKAAAALARGDFPYSTGQVVMVDGGMTVGRL